MMRRGKSCGPVVVVYLGPRANGTRETDTASALAIKCGRWEGEGLSAGDEPVTCHVDSTPSARVIIAAKQRGLNVGLLTYALMRAVWVDEANVSEPAVLHSLLEAQALPAEDLLEWAGSDDVSDEYAANTEEAITQGVFGVPAYALCDDLLWGQDRLDFVEALLAKARAPG